MKVLHRELMAYLRESFYLDWQGIHGAPHWARVRLNGLAVAERNGADKVVVQLFSVLHDSRRFNDGTDAGHGARGAEHAAELNGRFFHLNPQQLDDLQFACSYHSDGMTRANPTVQACWDADRLDLGRVGIRPNPKYLCTEAAKAPALLDSAYRRSVAGWFRHRD